MFPRFAALVTVLSLPAMAAAPTVTTNTANGVTATTANLNGTANAGGEATIGWFRHSTTNPVTCNDSFGTRVPASSGTAVGSGTTNVPYSVSTTGLLPGTTYFFCAIVQNPSGTAFGNVLSFTTPALAPTVFSQAATLVTSSSAQLNGTATPNGALTTGYFRYSTSNPGGSCSTFFGTRVPASSGTSLGAGNSSQNYAETITGLLPGTTYYFCAFADNAVGTGIGVPLSLTTLVAAPTTTTGVATGIGSTSATLPGTINPNGAATNGWFRISTSDPGTCNDAFGTRVPLSGSSSVGSGTSAVSYSQVATSLTGGTTYYYCAIGQNSEGTTFGIVRSFTTPDVPVVTTDPETFVASTSASLNGTGTPNLSSTTVWFRYSPTNPGVCDDAFGIRAPSSGGTFLGSGSTPVTFARAITGLLPGTTYYFCAIAQNGVGTTFGGIRSFTTPPAIPSVVTSSPTLVTGTTLTLNGSANPSGAVTTGYFRFSTTNPGPCNDTFGTRVPATGGTNLGSGNGSQAFNQPLTGLTQGTTYFYCAIAINSAGTGFGSVTSVTTPNVPTLTTSTVTGLGGTFVTLNGVVNPNLSTATAYFRYSTSNPGTCDDSFGTRAPATGGTSASFNQAYAQSVSGLTPGTTYYYCAIAVNAEGTGFGAVLSFLTPAAPTMVTNAPTALTATSVTLNGTGTPNNASTNGWFRYDSSNPGACSDSFGFRAPFSGSTFLGSGTVPQTYAQSISLTPGTTYWYCAIGSNSVGTSFGALETFTAPATAPIVTTTSATLVTGTTATLNGNANPRGAASTGYFRYSTTSPGTCNDSFGTRAPATGGTTLGSGNSAISYAEALTGLLPGTTYYFCAIATNAVGTGLGSVFSFTTPNVPTVTTSAVTGISGTSATLNGFANPQGASATGFFRYGVTDPGTCNDSYGTRHPSAGGTSLGSGTSSVSFSQSLTGLSPGTTYFVCALAVNSVGTGVGLPVTFTTPAAPTVTTLAATSVTATAGTLNATGIPNGSSAIGWFRYATTNPGTCSDSFGTRAPLSSGNALGSGSSTTPFSVTPMGLLPGTTYYFCAIASNAVGVSFGAVLSFTTPALPPLVTSASTSFITDTSATLNGSATPRGDATTAWFRYSTVSPGSCNDSFGTRTPATGGTDVGSGNTAQTYTQTLTGLTPSTTYYWCAIAQNGQGTTLGTLVSFTTVALPTVVTQAASPVTSTTATINSTITPNGTSTTAWFRYSLTSPGACDDTFGTRIPASSGTFVGSGSTPASNSQSLSGLLPGNAYYFCAIAQNAIGTQLGSLLSFTTPPQVPSTTTVPPTGLTATSGTLNGSANPNGAATTAWFRFSTSNPGVCNDAFGTRVPATGGTAIPFGNSPVSYSQPVTGLSAGTTYYVCAIAQNSVGTSFGSVLTITTPGTPTAVTVSATAITSSGAQLNGTGNPNRADGTGYFRYSTTSPGTCNDTFGTRAPATGGSDLGNGFSAVSYSQALTGLAAGTTYFYCAIVSNVVGTSFGAVQQFTTLNAPTMVTGAATALAGTTATLNATGNPNNATSGGWFRYSAVNPGTCNDTFGTRNPTGTTTYPLGAGSTPTAYSGNITGLALNTTYYFCAIGSNSAGTSFGAVETFTTPGLPTVATNPVTSVASTTATFEGAATPNLAATTGWFRYTTSFISTCNDSFGTRVPATGGTALGSGTMPVPFSEPVTGLTAFTTYYVCAIAQNSTGTSFGTVRSFTTTAAPAVTTSAATLVTGSGATLNGSANPRGTAGTGWFRYSSTSPGACNDSFGTRVSMAGTSLGSGSSNVVYAEAITGLSPATTYYFCAIASNAIGTTLGTLLSFTTPSAPTMVTTNAASAVLGSTATLNGAANPSLAATTGYFRYSTTNPGTCNDTFGTRAPAASGSSLGSGSASQSYSQAITGLSSSTTYYFCAIAQNSEGIAFGTVQQFTTLNAPIMVTGMATAVTSTSATLNATGNPNGTTGSGWFRYSSVDPGSCDNLFGTRLPTSGAYSIGSGSTAQAYSGNITGLLSGTTYYFCAIGSNAVGTAFGQVQTFVTPGAPSVVTNPVVTLGSTTATLEGAAVPNLGATTGWFRYTTAFTSSCTDAFGTRVPSMGGTSLGSGSTSVPFTEALTGLLPATTYYYCAIAQNASGTRFGVVRTFTTAATPIVTTSAATLVTATTATLNGSANPRGSAGTGWFRYAATSPGSCNDTFGTRVSMAGAPLGSGSTAVAYSEPVTGLTPGTTYYVCAIASNAVGTGFGTVSTFSTPGAPSSVTTSAATSVLGTTATLNGSANPNRSATTGYFRYSTTSPGTCNDTFGTRLPSASGTSLGAGSTAQSFSQSVSGLASLTTYYFCAIAENAEGTSFGAVLSFTTAAAPTVTTTAATSVTASSAVLNGTVNPNGNASNGWFRYATTSPGTCNDTFGTRFPLAPGTSVGSGTTAAPLSATVTGLLAGTTYYFCALASNGVGTGVGPVLSFSTPGQPTVNTNAATGVSSSVATLNGTTDPRGADTTGYFRFSTATGTCSNSFGFRAPAAGGTLVPGTASASPFSAVLSGLSPATTYYFCAVAQNSVGTVFGSVFSFTTPTGPSVATGGASAVTTSSATLNATVNPLGDATTAWFRFSATDPGTCNDTFGVRAPLTAIAVGSGSAPAPVTTNLSGLTSSTTYYFCVIAQNSNGLGFGAVQTFFTPGAPVVTTTAAANVTASGALVGGTVNPSASATTAWVRYSAMNPGTCNDTFGTRFPAASGSNLGSGTTPQNFTQGLTGLSGATTYYFCAIAQNSVGTTFGAVLSFTTLAAPAVTTVAASGVTATGASLNGTATPFGAATTGYFRYATTSPGACDDTFGTRAPTFSGAMLGTGGTPQAFSQTLTGLTPGVTYHYCAIAQNSVGTSFGAVMSFTTGAAPPTATTQAATMVAGIGATLNGAGTPNGSASTGYFRYGTTNPGSCTDSFGTRAPASGGTALGSGSTATNFSEAVMGLTPGATYYFCAAATSAAGTGFGSVQSFTTPRAPTVTTTTGQPTSASQATVNGTVTPNGDAATAYFRYGTTNPTTCDDNFGTRFPASGGVAVPSGANAQAVSQTLTGLSGGTRYYFCAAATNVVGTSFGTVQSFTTPGVPVVVTSSASSANTPSPRLNGSVNPTGAPTVAWFRLATMNPGSCNDTFGRRAPVAGGTTVPAGTTDVSFSEVVTGLEPGVTYYFCAIAENPLGKSFGQVLQFNSYAPPPTVTTSAATDVQGTGATFSGSANPNGTTATGWFRYADVQPTSCDDMFGTRVPAMGGMTLGAGTAAQSFTLAVTSLRPNTKYYYCAVASNMGGAAFGNVEEFQTTSAPPIAKTISVEASADGTVVFKGTVNPNGSPSSAAFRYAANNPGTCSFGFGTRVPVQAIDVPPGFTDVPLTQTATGVRPGTYYACLFAQNFAGDSGGEVLTFTVEGAQSGCGCSSGLDGAGASGVLALALALLSRRRRTTTRGA